MFLIEFNLGFQEVSENLQQIGTAAMKKRASISHNSVRKGVAVSKVLFPFPYSISCLPGPKNSSSTYCFILQVVSLCRDVLKEEKKLGICAEIFLKTSCPRTYNNLAGFLFYLKKENQMLRFNL